eukprot:PhF_6_TR21714/c0_g1_i2/m.31025
MALHRHVIVKSHRGGPFGGSFNSQSLSTQNIQGSVDVFNWNLCRPLGTHRRYFVSEHARSLCHLVGSYFRIFIYCLGVTSDFLRNRCTSTVDRLSCNAEVRH